MSVLRNLESRIAGLVEGTFGRVFSTPVRPVEIARRLVKEMDEHRTVSVSRTYVPNEYVVWLSPEDRESFAPIEQEVADELAVRVLEHARGEKLALVSRPVITFETDERLHLGEFGIQARLVRPNEAAAPGIAPAAAREEVPAVVQAEHGNTMVFSSADRLQEPLEQQRAERRGRAIVVAEGRRMVVPAGGAVLGRSRDCDVVIGDSNVSRRHAEIRPHAGGWVVEDLGSTNGVRVNGRPVDGPTRVTGGDRIELGTVPITFEVD
ncbi:FhaA domain-containing protein [Paraconexibacter sp.]|uniref:FhaA domain-containing protein n=1 Tax=Paraconexibacter sp. TaxID=2949640 RepID=UPI003565790A